MNEIELKTGEIYAGAPALSAGCLFSYLVIYLFGVSHDYTTKH
jgi:hypothetical protein